MSVSVEMAPIAKVGGLADVVTSLGLAVQAEGHKVEVVLPKYERPRKYDLAEDFKGGGIPGGVDATATSSAAPWRE